MPRCAFCGTENGVRLAVVVAEGQREPVDACRCCVKEYGLTTSLVVADLAYPRGGGDLQPEITGVVRPGGEVSLLLAVAVARGGRVNFLNSK